MKAKQLLWVLLLLALAYTTTSGQAQSAVRLLGGVLHLDKFPILTTYLNVWDAQGFFMSGLSREDILIIENGQEFAPTSLSDSRVGSKIVLAVNVGTPLLIQDEAGLQRLDYMKQAIAAWMQKADLDGTDTYTLLSNEGLLINHTDEGAEISERLQNYEIQSPPLPTWEVLSTAIDQASDPLPREGMGRAVFLITPLLSTNNPELIQSLADRAKQAEVRVFIALIDSSLYFGGDEARQMQQLAAQTGGQFFVFSGSEALPDLNALFESSRRVYQLAYYSQVFQSGTHTLEIGLKTNNGVLKSAPFSFSLDIQPPALSFVSLPVELLRSVPEGQQPEADQLQPKTVPIEAEIQFMDGLPRGIVRTLLYANGQFVQENIAPPFTDFRLDLQAYSQDEVILLRLEAYDELGLMGTSLETPLLIKVLYPEEGLGHGLKENRRSVAVLFGVLAVSLLLLVMVLSGKLRPKALYGSQSSPQAKNRPLRSGEQTPPNQESLHPNTKPFLNHKLKASLQSLSDNDEPFTQIRVSLYEGEVVLGSQRGQTGWQLQHPAIAAVHASLRVDKEGRCWLQDLGSTAGTWVNYERITGEVEIFHLDRIHFADIGFQLNISAIKTAPELVFTPKN